MKIIIDTNIINKDYKLHGKYIVTLSGAAAKLGYDVCVPEVVVDEIVSHYKDELLEAHDTYNKGVSKLKKLLPEMPKCIKDFADASGLHKDLKNELLELGYSDNVIELVTDCEKFFKDVIHPEFEELDKIKEAFNAKGSYNRISVQNDIAQLFNMQFVEHMLDSVDDYGLQMYLPYYCESPFVEFVDDPIVETESVIRLADGTVMIGCNVRIGAEISYYIDRSNFGDAYDDIHPHVTNYEHNDHYLEVSNLIELNAVVNIRTSKMLSKILTTEVIPRSISFVPYEVTKTREEVE